METDQVLIKLARLCKASEKGYIVAAEGIRNRGLKLLFKTFAQQRSEYVSELQAEIQRAGRNSHISDSFRGFLHRGWISVKVAMIIGHQNRENAVLAECGRGERVILQAYQEAVNSELPPTSRAIVERQYEQIQDVARQIIRLRGGSGYRLVIRLFNQAEDAARAVQALQAAGFVQNTIETVPFNQVIRTYRGEDKQSTILQSAIALALGGIFALGLLGLLTGISMIVFPETGSISEASNALTVIGTTVIGALIGAAIGALMGALMGASISQEDSFLYEDGMMHGDTMIMISVEDARAAEAADIMYQVNASARAFDHSLSNENHIVTGSNRVKA